MNAQTRTAQATVKVLAESPALTVTPLTRLAGLVQDRIARDGALFTLDGYPYAMFLSTVAVARRDFIAAV